MNAKTGSITVVFLVLVFTGKNMWAGFSSIHK